MSVRFEAVLATISFAGARNDIKLCCERPEYWPRLRRIFDQMILEQGGRIIADESTRRDIARRLAAQLNASEGT